MLTALPALADDAPDSNDPRAELLGLAEALADAGRQRIASESIDKDERLLQRQLKLVRYDAESVEALAEALAIPEDPAVAAYVAAQLFKPLLHASDETARAILDLVQSTYQGLGPYQPLPAYTRDELERLIEPTQRPGESDAAFEGRRQRHAERLAEKQQAEREAQLHNTSLALLEGQSVQLMLRVDSRRADAELLNWMVAAEKDQVWSFTRILGAIRTAARDMDQERALRFYKALQPLLTPASMTAREYVDPGEVLLSDTANGAFAVHTTAPGEHVLKTLNHLATPAEVPAIVGPPRPSDEDD